MNVPKEKQVAGIKRENFKTKTELELIQKKHRELRRLRS